MASENTSLELLAQTFETLADCAKKLNWAGAEFEPSALDFALNLIGQRFYVADSSNRTWREEQYKHWIAEAPSACQKLIRISRSRSITKNDVRLVFKAPPPD